MSKKKSYQPRNWASYNKSLIQRGSLDLWISDEVLSGWYETSRSDLKGRPQLYADSAILCAQQIRMLFGLTLRQTEGFLVSFFKLIEVHIKVPSYTCLCRRLQSLQVKIPRTCSKEPRHIVIDSTGLKVYGDGEWHVRTHGVSKRRTWRKIHLGIDVATQEVVCTVVSTNDVQDQEVFERALNQLPKGSIKKVCADGIYDAAHCYEYCYERGIEFLSPPREGAVFSKNPALEKRNEAIRWIKEASERDWKLGSGYSKRSLVETAMYRFKQIFSDRLKGKKFISQAKEVFIKCTMLNKFTQLGLPQSNSA